MAQKKLGKTDKRSIIARANSSVVVAVSVAVFVLMFSGFAVKALVGESLYNGRVIKQKKAALATLQKNAVTVEDLESVYVAFATEPTNVIGGAADGSGPKDGSNPKLVLDALPSEYDFPGLSSSLEKILVDGGYTISSLGGQEQSSDTDGDSSSGVTVSGGVASPIEISYPINVKASVASAKKLLETLEKSIRPFYVDSLTLKGSSDSLDILLSLRTFYQPGVGLQVSSKVVK